MIFLKDGKREELQMKEYNMLIITQGNYLSCSSVASLVSSYPSQGSWIWCPSQFATSYLIRQKTLTLFEIIFYLRTTQWERPTRPAVPNGPTRPESNSSKSSNENRSKGSLPPRGNRSSMVETSSTPPPPLTSQSSSEGGGPGQDRSRRRDYMTRNTLHRDGVVGMPLPEGYEQRTTQQGQVYFLHTQTGVSSWHDPRIPRQLTHIRGDDLGNLPPGWEMRTTSTGRVYYVDHSSRTTQFTDPRISIYIDNLQNRGRGNGEYLCSSSIS